MAWLSVGAAAAFPRADLLTADAAEVVLGESSRLAVESRRHDRIDGEVEAAVDEVVVDLGVAAATQSSSELSSIPSRCALPAWSRSRWPTWWTSTLPI